MINRFEFLPSYRLRKFRANLDPDLLTWWTKLLIKIKCANLRRSIWSKCYLLYTSWVLQWLQLKRWKIHRLGFIHEVILFCFSCFDMMLFWAEGSTINAFYFYCGFSFWFSSYFPRTNSNCARLCFISCLRKRFSDCQFIKILVYPAISCNFLIIYFTRLYLSLSFVITIPYQILLILFQFRLELYLISLQYVRNQMWIFVTQQLSIVYLGSSDILHL